MAETQAPTSGTAARSTSATKPTPATKRTPVRNASAATKSTTTTKRATAATQRSTTAKKAATTRKSNATSATASKTAKRLVPKVQTPAARARAYAEKAVLIPVGAALIAKDRVAVSVEKYGSVDAAQKQLALLRKELSADVKQAEKRGTTARRAAEREVKKTRTKVERELRTRRTSAERELTRNRNKAEKEIKSLRSDLDQQVSGLRRVRRDIGARTDLVTATAGNVVATVNKTGAGVANTVVERVAALA